MYSRIGTNVCVRVCVCVFFSFQKGYLMYYYNPHAMTIRDRNRIIVLLFPERPLRSAGLMSSSGYLFYLLPVSAGDETAYAADGPTKKRGIRDR